MTDTPAICIPPDPSVSGFWHVVTDEKSNDGREVAEWMTYGGLCTPHWRSRGTVLSILGPVATHAEVEALRAEIQRLRATIEIVHYKLGTGGWALPLILRDMQDALNGQSDAATRALLREIGLLRAEGTALIQTLFALPKGTLVVPPSAQTAIHNAILAASAPAPEDK